jgi:hypothetical protein
LISSNEQASMAAARAKKATSTRREFVGSLQRGEGRRRDRRDH